MDTLKKEIHIFAGTAMRVLVLSAVAPLLTLLLLSSCASTSQHISSSSEKKATYIAHEKIIIMPAVLKYVSISNDAPLPPATYKGEEAGAFLVSYSSELLSKKGFSVLNAKALSSEDSKFRKAYNEILGERISLFRSSSNPDLTEDMKVLAESSNNAGILIFMLRVKVGPSGTWNPYTGAITSSSSYTRLKALLVETGSGRKLWKNEVQLREIPAPESHGYKDAVKLLLENLKTDKGGQSVQIIN
ncbi:MAG: hypothetical protein GXO94_08380 [Nitrospirae bacterium]|nr:hypothetical protein [Nitrospirota bacterium]